MIRDMTEVASQGLPLTQSHISSMRGLGCCGYVEMKPNDFLDLTTKDAGSKRAIINAANTLHFYTNEIRAGRSRIPPFLYVEIQREPVGRILGHEGRHRAGACVRAGVQTFHVFLLAKVHGITEYELNETPQEGRGLTRRTIRLSDFPEELIGQYTPTRVPLDKTTWVPIQS